MLPNVVRAQIDVAAHRALEASYDVARRSRMTYKNPILCIVQLVCFMAYLVACRQPWQNYLFRQPLFFMGYRVWQLNMVKIRKACRLVWNAGLYLDQAVQVLPMMELIHHFGARLGLTGAAVNGLIGRVAPRFARIFLQKLASKTLPVLGAAAGASTNYAFTNYYIQMAHVHFGLRKLACKYGEQPVLDVFHRMLASFDVAAKCS